ncbi:MAG: sigma factor-like helix-turn-helix DNA-binding protein [Planctomycetota bacterium]
MASSRDENGLKPGPVCGVCPLFPTCVAVCEPVEQLLPSMERGRVDPEDLPRLHMGIRLTNAILDHEQILSPRQREVVRLYFRESLQQQDIADRLKITQQAVNDVLKRARVTVGKYIHELRSGAVEEVEGAESPVATKHSSLNTLPSTSHRRP